MNNFIFHFLLSFSFYKIVLDWHDFEKIQKNIKRTYPVSAYTVFFVNEFNMICNLLTFTILMEMEWYNKNLSFSDLYRIIIVYTLSEFYFYTTHRFLLHGHLLSNRNHTSHTKNFSLNIHAIHHTFRYPIPRAAFYMHPLENIISSIGTFVIPLLLVPLSYYATMVWTAIILINAIRSHSGLVDKYNPHDYHHVYGRYNYGAGFLMDLAYGTNLK